MSERRLSGTSRKLRCLPGTIAARTRRSRVPRQPDSSRLRVASALAAAGLCSLLLDADCFGLLTTTAQAQTKPAPQSSDVARALLIDSQPDDLALKQLSSTGWIYFVPDYPLKNVLANLSRQYEVPIVVDQASWDELGIPDYESTNLPPLGTRPSEDNPFPFWNDSLTLSQILDVVLDEPNLSWYVRDGIITVTSPEAQSKYLFPRSYDVGVMRRKGVSAETLTEVLQKHTNANREKAGGTGGRISVVGNVLTVWQSYQVHRQVRGLLLKLAEPGGSPWIDYAEERRRLAVILRKPTRANYPNGIVLRDFVNDMSRSSAIPIAVDEFAINDAEVWLSDELMIPPIGTIPLEAVLKMAFNGRNVALVLRNGVPTLTSLADANDPGNFPAAVYDVRGLPGTGTDGSELLDAVRAIADSKWKSADQPGGRMTLTENGLLVVSQSDQVHRTLQRLLEAGNR